ncbi:MAG: ABC transporter ATP-binding protein [Chloroflexi bacterium]|nr:ABC transporter ATP-binding protein [Chloroflexota bacterium]NOG64956.1 ABC transporter ATP-binding protein [Chloroflexota bacterium]
MSEAFIRIQNLVKSYNTPAGSVSVLNEVNLEIQRGEMIALVGPSGSGKTTFLNMLTGIDKPNSGHVQVDGVNITRSRERKLTKWRAKNVGIVFQFFQLLPTLSVANNVVAPMDFAGMWKPNDRHDIALQLLDRLGIKEQAYKTPDMLSGGQQQRVAIARALANNPALIIGDEPTANLDRMSAANVFHMFRQLAERGSTVIFVTHDRELVKNVPKILELSHGQIHETSLAAIARHRTDELKAVHTRTQEMRALKLAKATH